MYNAYAAYLLLHTSQMKEGDILPQKGWLGVRDAGHPWSILDILQT